MRNKIFNPKTKKILSLVKTLPYFTLNNLIGIEKDKNYLRIFLYRYEKAGKIIRLKKGVYTTKEYVDEIQKKGIYSSYQEFLGNSLYEPSYLSLDYVLYENNLMTEMPVNFTLITRNKTAVIANAISSYYYHKIKDKLFLGYNIINKDNFTIYKATKAKALFDYLYLRKNQITNAGNFDELRLNTENLSKKDLSEFKNYVDIEGSKKMNKIYLYLKGKND